VQRKHVPQELAYEACCSCGTRFEYDQDGYFAWAEHVAFVIESQLGSVETRTVRSICDMADPGIPQKRIVIVTKWENADA
jgi:hypothetical protein